MKDSKDKSSKLGNAAGSDARKPFGDVTAMEHVPIAMFEVLHLAGSPTLDDPVGSLMQIQMLQSGIIGVMSGESDALKKLADGLAVTKRAIDAGAISV